MANKNKGNTSEATKQTKYTKQMTNDVTDYSSLKVVLFYCSLIVFLPVITFFCLKHIIIHKVWELTEVASNICSAIGSVLALHFAVALYIYRAYFVSSVPSRNKMD